MDRIGFDNETYLDVQLKEITERMKMFENKLYLEFGGKLIDDFHASRVLPGFKPDSSVHMLKALGDIVEIVLVISAVDIEHNRIQGDYGITYYDDMLRLIGTIRANGLYISSIVITKYSNQKSVNKFKGRVEALGLRVYILHLIDDYPANLPLIISDDGFGRNDYIETTRPLVVVAASGSSSGKMVTCLSQLYHEMVRGVRAGYAKYEKFPIWNLPLTHPINLAYEAATVDIDDKNMIDPFHIENYGVSAVSYNRDVDAFPVLNAVFKRIWGDSPYKSPTDMGVNMFAKCIIEDGLCQQASRQEIIRRYYTALCEDWVYGRKKTETQKIERLMNIAGISADERHVVSRARDKAEASGTPCMAIELPNGHIVTGKTTALLSAPSSALFNALKILAGINDSVRLISPAMIEPIQKLNINILGNDDIHLHLDEILVATAISSPTNPVAELVLDQIPKLKNSEAHSTVILPQSDINVFRKLGINITCEPGGNAD